MNCPEVRERLAAYLENDPPVGPADREAIREHLAGCPGCRAGFQALREQVALLRAAGAWARGLAGKPALPRGAPLRPGRPRAARRRRGARRLPVGWLVAAAALLVAALAGWKLTHRDGGKRREEPPGHLLAGELLESGQPAGLLAVGRSYLVPPGEGAEIDLRGGATVRAAGGTRFQVPEGFDLRPGLGLVSGALTCRSNTLLELRTPGITARARGRFAMAAGAQEAAPAGPRRAAASWTDWLFPPALAAEPAGSGTRRGPEAFVLLAGRAEVAVGDRELDLAGRRALVGADGAEPAVGVPEKLLESMAAERDRLLEGLLTPRYRAIIAEYAARRAGYIGRLAAEGLSEAGRADLDWRIALMDELRAAHAARLGSLAAEEGGRLRGAELVAARRALLGRLMAEIRAAVGRPER